MRKTNRVLPILFNTDMVQAILDGRKTATRRVIKPQPDEKHNYPLGFITDSTEKKDIGSFGFGVSEYGCSVQFAKPPYRVGNILYVRETWERFDCCSCEGDAHGNCPKEPEKSVLDKYGCGCYMYRATDEIGGDARWHPSIHMPKEAARIWLKVTDVRVERLQDITEDGSKSEGARQCYEVINTLENRPVTYLAEDRQGYYVLGFKNIWDSTIKKSDKDKYSWDANPWVWVIEFERIEKPEDV